MTLLLTIGCSGTPGLTSVQLPGTSGDCLVGGRAAAAKLAAESRLPVDVRWDDQAGRPRRIHGGFAAAERAPADAARAFLARHAGMFHLALDPAALEVSATRQGQVGTYVRFAQRAGGLPVLDGEVIVHVVAAGGGLEVRDVNLAQRDGAEALDARTAVPESQAVGWAREALGVQGELRHPAESTLGVLVQDKARLAYRVLLATAQPVALWEVTLDAVTGDVLATRDRLWRAEGSALVFDANPVSSTGDYALADNDDQDAPELDAARVRVTLNRLDDSGMLRGQFAEARNPRSRAQETSGVFDYSRSDPRFEEVMAYYHLDRTQAHLQFDLGFTDANNRKVLVYVNGITEENSFYDPQTRTITTGTGGVDDAEDADVLVHEYGHSVQDNQVPGFGGGDEGAMGEGFGDYLAGTMADQFAAHNDDPACMAEWDGVSLPHSGDFTCMRRLDGTKHYPEAQHGEVHDDGEIWSAALWRARTKLGAEVMDQLVIEAHFGLSTSERFLGAADSLVAADQNLFAGQHVAALKRALVTQGLSRDLVNAPALPKVLDSVAVEVANPRNASGKYTDMLDDTQVIHVPGALGLRVHFAKVETELDHDCLDGACDNIYLYDADGNLYDIINGVVADAVSLVVAGDTVQVRLVTDPSVNKFGYLIDRVDVMGLDSCGNGAKDPGEACDGADLGGATCASLGFHRGTLACRSTCTVDSSACVGVATCGNGTLDAQEECDGQALGPKTCQDLGFLAGRMSCNADCAYDPALCNTCGNNTREGAEECDGTDLQHKTCADLGFTDGTLACSPSCAWDTAHCTAPACQ